MLYKDMQAILLHWCFKVQFLEWQQQKATDSIPLMTYMYIKIIQCTMIGRAFENENKIKEI